MKYLCVGYFDHVKMDMLPKTEAETVMSDCPVHMEELYKSGKIVMVAGVDAQAKCLHRVGGSVEITDGPIEGRENTIGCVFLIEALDMAEAIRIASLHPTTQIPAGEHLGWHTEIRPVHYFKG